MGGGLTQDTPAAAKEAAVAERAKARWEALVRKDYKAAYEYFSPASREAVALSKFEGQARVVQYRGANVDKVNCVAEICKVTLSLTYDHKVMKGIVTPIQETWLIDGGKAWLVYAG